MESSEPSGPSAPPAFPVRVEAWLTLHDLIVTLWRGRWWMVLGVTIGFGLGIAAGFKMTRMWRAQVVFTPVQQDRGLGALSGLTGQMGDIAGLLGSNLGGSGGLNRNVLLAQLTSRQFTEDFIRRHDLMPILFWKRWDSTAKRWKVDQKDVPTMEQAFLYFDNRIRKVREDKKTGLISMSVDWRDRAVAADWANLLIQELNEEARARAISDAGESLRFLKGELEKAQIVPLQEAISRMMESNLKAITVAQVRRDFAFQVIDRAVPSDADRYVRPNWIVLVFIGALLGFMGSAFLVVVAELRRRFRNPAKTS